MSNGSAWGTYASSLSTAAASYIVSVQKVSLTIPTGATSATATITSVNTSNAVIIWDGFVTTDANLVSNEVITRIELTNATTVTAYRNTSSAIYTTTTSATVIEFATSLVKTVQAGTITLSSAQTSNTATISSVSTSNATIIYLNLTSASTGTSAPATFGTLALTNSTTVTATRNATGSVAMTIGYMVLEFQPAVIQSIQQVATILTSANTSDTATISSITTSNAMLFYNGISASNATFTNSMYNVLIAGATSVTLSRNATNAGTRTIQYTVVEFVAGVLNSAQRNTTSLGAASTSVNTTITTVNTAKAFANFTGQLSSTPGVASAYSNISLTNATTLNAARNSSTGTTIPAWEVVEFI